MEELPLLGITMGDPSGIGPEIIVKALCQSGLKEISRTLVLGDPKILERAARIVGADVRICPVSSVEEARFGEKSIEVMALSCLDPSTIAPGKATPLAGEAMARYIKKAVDMAVEGVLDAVVTCPINKRLLRLAGYDFEGHTQMIGRLTGVPDPVMMLAGKRLRVSLVTIHCALREVPGRLSTEGILRVIRVTAQSLVNDFRLKEPRIGVAGVNPHAGEDGLFGDEEQKFIAPAVMAAVREGWEVEGPLPADTLFWRALQGEFDAVVAMYHDQGLAPLKAIHFRDGVNVTLGLPIVRTSVDHGVAYDLAGTGRANHESLVAAINTAAMIASNRSRIA